MDALLRLLDRDVLDLRDGARRSASVVPSPGTHFVSAGGAQDACLDKKYQKMYDTRLVLLKVPYWDCLMLYQNGTSALNCVEILKVAGLGGTPPGPARRGEPAARA